MELLPISRHMRQVQLEGEVGHRPICTASAEDGVENGELLGHLHCPCEEHVGNDADQRFTIPYASVAKEALKVGLEGLRGTTQVTTMVMVHVVGALEIWRQPVFGAVEWELP